MGSNASSLLVFATLVAAAAAVAQPTEPVHVHRTRTLSATVEAIDLDRRLVELRAGDRSTTVQVPPEVRNLAQIKVGDRIVIEYYEGLAAGFKQQGAKKTTRAVDASAEVAQMPRGGKPGRVAGNTATATVVIESVDRSTHSVTFTGPGGMTRTIDVEDPKAREFIGKLKKGDEVELTYTEALAVSVESAPADERQQ